MRARVRIAENRGAFRRAAFAVALVAMAASAELGLAQATWTTATSGTWGDASKWSTGIVPGVSNSTAAVLSDTSASYTVTSNTTMTGTLGSLTLSNITSNTTTLAIQSGLFRASSVAAANAIVNITSGTFVANGFTASASSEINVQGGVFTSINSFNNSSNLRVSLTSGTVNTTNGYFITPLTMSGGYFFANAGRDVRLSGTISGGTIESASYIANNGSVLVFSGNAVVNTNSLQAWGTNGGDIRIQGGDVTITGSAFYVGSTTASGNRSAAITQSGGTVSMSDATGLIIGNSDAGISTTSTNQYTLSGGLLAVEKIMLNAPGVKGGTDVLTVSGGVLNLGAGGIVNGGGLAAAVQIRLSGGTIGAKADWSSSVAMSLPSATGTATFRASDASDIARNITLSGVLSGSGALAKTGGGVLTLSNANTYLGATRISGGRLLLSGSGSINSSSGITLNGGELKTNSSTAINRSISFGAGGGTISGTGTIASLVTAGAGAILSPGNSPGIQEYSSGLVWNPGGTYLWEANALEGTAGVNWDLITVSGGALDLRGLTSTDRFALDLTTLGAGNTAGSLVTPYDGSSYTFQIASFSSLLVSGTYSAAAGSDLTSLFSFNNLVNWQGAKPAVGDLSVKVNSTATGLELVIVPEPDTVIFAGIGVAMVGWSLWKRRRIARIMKRD